jgi:hypothetical protein
VDVTTIVTAAVAGMSGIGGGYLGMRQQLQAVREQFRAELEREREQRQEERQDRRLDMRLDTYHRFLDIERRLRRLLASSRTFSENEYGKWSSEFNELYHLVALIGTEQVQMLADRMLGLFRSMDTDRMRLGGERLADDLKAAFRRYETELEETRVALMAAMRRDVAAPEPPPADISRSLPPADISTRHDRIARHIAIVAEADTLTRPELERVVGAVQKQISRDLAPTWGVEGNLVIYETSDDSPADSILVVMKDELDVPGAATYHTVEDGRPVGFVQVDDELSLRLSHTCLEMLVSPQSDRYIPGISPKPDQASVQFLVQVCDPCASSRFGYEIDGTLVSDFCTPDFYEAGKTEQMTLDHTGAITAPRCVAPGGYLSWYDADSRHMWQVIDYGDRPSYRDLGYYENAAQAADAMPPAGVGYFG